MFQAFAEYTYKGAERIGDFASFAAALRNVSPYHYWSIWSRGHCVAESSTRDTLIAQNAESDA